MPRQIWSVIFRTSRLDRGSYTLGCVSGNSSPNPCLQLSEHNFTFTFTHEGVEYTVLGVVHGRPGGNLSLSFDRGPPTDWALRVGDGVGLSPRDTEIRRLGNTERYYAHWKSAGQNWRAGNKVWMTLVEVDDSAPTVSLSASPNPVLEGERFTVTAKLSAPLSDDVPIPVVLMDRSRSVDWPGSLSSIVVPAGALTGTVETMAEHDANGSSPFEAHNDEIFLVELAVALPVAMRLGDPKSVSVRIIGDSPLPTAALAVSPSTDLREGGDGQLMLVLSRIIELLGYLAALGVWMGCLVVLHVLSGRMPPAAAGLLYLAFTAVTGVVISQVFWEHTGDTIALAFVLTTAVFVAMSVLGYAAKRDLSGLGAMCFAGLLGLVVTGVANWFIGSNLLSWIISLAALPIFLGFTVCETREVKEMARQAASEGDERAAGRVAVMGPVGLYLSFINVCLILLRILDAFSDE